MKFKRILIVMCFFAVFIIGNNVCVFANELNNLDSKIIEDRVDVNKIWNIKFSKRIDVASLNGNKIYVTDPYGYRVGTLDIELLDSNTISVSNYEEYQYDCVYTLHIEKEIFDVSGQTLNQKYERIFKTERKMNSSFNVKNIEVFSDKALFIEFTEAIDEKAEIPLFYEIVNDDKEVLKGSYDNFAIEKVDYNENAVIIKINNNDFQLETNSSIKILGELKSKQGSRFNNGMESWNIITKNEESLGFKAISADFINDTTIEIKFNKILDSITATSEINFRVYNPKNQELPIKEIQMYDSKTLRIKLKGEITEIGEFGVYIKRLKDYSKEQEIRNEEFKFEIDSIKENIIQYEAKVIDIRTIEVKFKEKIDKTSAYKTMFYLLQRPNDDSYSYIPQGIYFDEITKDRVKLFYDIDINDDDGYKLVVSKFMKNIYGEIFDIDSVKYLDGSNVRYSFDLEDIIVGSNTIDLVFSSEFIYSNNIFYKENYTLKLDEGNGRKVIIDCNGVEQIDGKTIRLKFDGMKDDEEYKLLTGEFQGYFGEKLKFEDGIDISN